MRGKDQSQSLISQLQSIIYRSMNNSDVCEVIEAIDVRINFEFNPKMIISPVIAIIYGYQFKELYENYNKFLTPIDILELNCLCDRTLMFFAASLMTPFASMNLEQTWFCFTLKFFLSTMHVSFNADFLLSQIESFYFVHQGSKYQSQRRTKLASKLVHGTKLFAVLIREDFIK